MADKPKDTRSLRERMKSRTADLDAAIDASAGVGNAPPPADSNLRKKANQSTDKNNPGY